jgi:hypothetical protein
MQLLWRQALVAATIATAFAQKTDPISHDSQLVEGKNKFRTRDIVEIEKHVFGTDASNFDPITACPHRYCLP